MLQRTPKDNNYLLSFKENKIISPPVRPFVDDSEMAISKQKVIKENVFSNIRRNEFTIEEPSMESPVNFFFEEME